MQVANSKEHIRDIILNLRKNDTSIGFVPTMGALHKGHLSLIKKALQENDVVFVSIFVNPTQFDNKKDLKNYPRTLDRDLELLKTVSDSKIFVYAPTVEDIYGKHPKAKRKLIEDKANGPAIINTLKHEISGIIPYNPGSDSKEARASACTPQIESGNVYIPHPLLYDWVDKYIDVWAKFPLVKHDEEVDITSQALNYWDATPEIRIRSLG